MLRENHLDNKSFLQNDINMLSWSILVTSVMVPEQNVSSTASCAVWADLRATAATTALLLVAVADVGLVPTSGPLTGLEMAAPRVVVVAQPRPRLVLCV